MIASDLIDRQDVYRYAKEHCVRPDGAYKKGYNNAMHDVISAVLNKQLIRPAESGQATGVWILKKPRRENRNPTFQCSVCGRLRSSYYNDVQNWKFCPCGALMQGVRKEDHDGAEV